MKVYAVRNQLTDNVLRNIIYMQCTPSESLLEIRKQNNKDGDDATIALLSSESIKQRHDISAPFANS